MVGSPPASAGDTGSSPDPVGSHMLQSSWARVPQLLSLCSGAREPQVLSLHVATAGARVPRARAPQQDRPPQLERALVQGQRPNAAKNKFF